MKKAFFYGLVLYYLLLSYFVPAEVARFSVLYFLLVLPILGFIGLFFSIWIKKYDQASLMLAIFLMIVLAVALLRLDFRTIQSAFLLFTTLIILANFELVLNIRIINYLFLLAIAGSVISFHAGINPYGYLPDISQMNKIIGGDIGLRISLFPLIPESAFFALFVIVCNYYYNTSKSRFLFYALGGYFLIFSSLRTAFVIFLFFILFEIIAKYREFKVRALFKYLSLFMVISFVLLINLKSLHTYLSQIDNDLLKTLLLREQVQAIDESSNVEDVATRMWIWKQHFQIFSNNPLFGIGTYEFGDFVQGKTKAYHFTTGSESFLTAWMARVGVSIVLIIFFFIRKQKQSLIDRDRFQYFMCFFFFLVMISYGSIVVPYNFMFLLIAVSLSRKPAD